MKDPTRCRGIEVIPKNDEHIEKAIKRFMKMVRNDGIIQEIYMRRAYEKPSVAKRKKHNRAVRALRKQNKDCFGDE